MESAQNLYYVCRQRGQALVETVLLMAVIAVAVFALFAIFGNPLKQQLLSSEGNLVAYVAGVSARPGADPNVVNPVKFPDSWYQPENFRLPQGGGGNIAAPPVPPAPPVPGAPVPPAPPIAEIPVPPAPAVADLGVAGAPPIGSAAGGAAGIAGGGDGSGRGVGDNGLAGTPSAAQRQGDLARSAGEGGGSRSRASQDEETPRTGVRVTTVNGEEVFFDAETGQWVSRSGRVLSAEEAAEAEKKSAREGKLAKGDHRVSRETRDLASTDWDWLMALKMAILVLLLVFIFYLAIGSVRRRRDNP